MLISSVLATVALAAQDVPPAAPSPPSERLQVTAAAVLDMPNTTLVGYPVTGGSRRLIRRMMNQSRPADEAGQRHDAVTNWRYQTRYSARNGVCDPATASVEYSIVVTLPDLEGRERLRRDDRVAWDAYFSALVGHEINHARIAQLGAERMTVAMRAAEDCAGIAAAAKTVMDEVAAASVQYDRQTRHGELEGAVF